VNDPEHYFLKRYHDSVRLVLNSFPKFLINLGLGFISKRVLGVNLDAPILKQNDPYNVIIYSHGFFSNRNLNSYYNKEWASQGFIVFAIDHNETIYYKINSLDEISEKVKPTLESRKLEFLDVLNFIFNIKQLKEVFGVSLTINPNIIGCGHSFGGATAYLSSFYDPRITSLILLDPWFAPLEEKYKKHELLNIPILCIRTEQFNHVLRGKDTRATMKIYHQQKKKNLLSCYVKGSTHDAQHNLIFNLPTEFILARQLHSWNSIVNISLVTHTLIQSFFNLILENLNNLKDVRLEVLKKYMDLLSRINTPDTLIVDTADNIDESLATSF
jgi:platelet-activating factor acetylhydrolase